MAGWITRDEALARLGIRAQSLYAYASRGRVAATPDPADPRRSLYSADDVAALADRRRRGRSRSAVASGSIAWGEPMLDTAISTVALGRLFYRGRDAAALAECAAFEDVAALLLGRAPSRASGPPGSGMGDAFIWLATQAGAARPSHGRTEASLAEEAAALLAPMACALGAASGVPVHRGFARAWDRPDAADAIRRALVLLADHELNPSTFATRVVASTGASLPACLLAGLATLSGPRHGAASTAALAFAREAAREGAAAAVRRGLAARRSPPGFGHPLYVGVDPRAAALLEAVPLAPALRDLCDAVFAGTGREPNIDFALAALAVVHDLPDDSPIRLFAAGRTAGWLAHAVEQALTGALIRPRARYTGPRAP